MFFSSFISATLFPFGSEALLVYNLGLDLNIYILVFVATLGNSLGSLVNYFLGLKGEDYLEKKNIINKKQINKAKVYFDKYGAYSLLLSWLPIIGDPITFIAGILKYNLRNFIILVVLAKFFRYFFIVIVYVYFKQ